MNEKGRWNGLPLVIFGSGGISREVAQLVEDINRNSPSKVFDLLGFVEKDSSRIGERVHNIKIISSDDLFLEFAKHYRSLGVVIPQGFPNIKTRIYTKLMEHQAGNLVFPNLIHPTIDTENIRLEIGIGNIICRNSLISIDVRIGNFNLINANADIGHDVVVGDFCVINSLTMIAGCVEISNGVTIGAGSSIYQGLKIGNEAVVGIGSSVIRDVPEKTTAMGVPAINVRI